ncbi:MAG TPA: 16S rRNA (cytosine(1402)-N(4))-methyltransferase RsmH [Bacillota bacterium]|nr:16S rRNA (cytosine(1402)-N(4))-methyltransferase RsmH [Bacillota bacterium]
MAYDHRPVMLEEVLACLQVRPGGKYLDCTVGGGGHLEAIAQLAHPGGRIVGIDRDPDAVQAAAARLAPWGARIFHADFGGLREVLHRAGIDQVDGVLFDLGASSHQLDTPARGFSYREDGPLDMRMDPAEPTTAGDLVNRTSADELTRIIRDYGEERWAKRIARAITAARPLTRTLELAEVIRESIPPAARRHGAHPARRTFQALRIAVNRELERIRPALEAAVDVILPGGRIGVISFHSLEDRIVKETVRDLARDCTCPPAIPACMCGGGRAKLRPIANLAPSPAEIAANPRSRSARLRVAERLVLALKGEE